MSARKKVTRENIVETAMDILRNEGYEAVKARTIAKKLGCSTQPIYCAFEGMDELMKVLKQKAAECHRAKVQLYKGKDGIMPYRAYGMGFARFAKEDRELFRYLYLRRDQSITSYYDVNEQEIYDTLCNEYGYSIEVAKHFHYDMMIYAYGIGVGISLGILNLTDEELLQRFNIQFRALASVYGAPILVRHSE